MRDSERKEEAPETFRELFLGWMHADWGELPLLVRGLMILTGAATAAFLVLSIIGSIFF